jgi:hypothetical protein
MMADDGFHVLRADAAYTALDGAVIEGGVEIWTKGDRIDWIGRPSERPLQPNCHVTDLAGH